MNSLLTLWAERGLAGIICYSYPHTQTAYKAYVNCIKRPCKWLAPALPPQTTFAVHKRANLIPALAQQLLRLPLNNWYKSFAPNDLRPAAWLPDVAGGTTYLRRTDEINCSITDFYDCLSITNKGISVRWAFRSKAKELLSHKG